VKCAQSHLTSECAKIPDTSAKCCNCSGDPPASFTQCPAYVIYLERHTQVTVRDNLNVSNFENKNLQTKDSCTKKVTPNIVTSKVSSDNRFNPLVNAKRNTNKFEERQIHPAKSYAATISNNNMTVNDDLSDLNGLMFKIQKLKQLVNIPHMIMVIRNYTT